MARTATGDNDDALDLVQDAMLQLVKHYSARPAAEWGPLFHRILQSRIRDWYRREQVRNRFRVWFGRRDEHGSGDAVEQQPDHHNPWPDANMVSHQAMVALEAGLRKLPLRQQQAFMLRVWEGMDVAQTAHAMRCSEGSVKTHYFRALRRLRGLLEDYW
jgi:RNA polymerase sigma-70 factor (ECF subfamily)